MLSVKINILCIIFMIIIVRIQSLVKLSILEDNSIKTAETAIRNTVNELFTILKIHDVKRSRLKQLFKIHNYFVSIMLRDCDNLEKVIGLSRVNDMENNTQHLITTVNEALNESYKSSEINSNNTFVSKYIERFIGKLKYLKKKYATERKTAINTEISNHRHCLSNETATGFNNSTETKEERDAEEENYSDFWKPSGRRIYEGFRTRIHHFPFMASILFFKKFQCAGAVIKNDLVITSASCLQLAWNNRFFRENPAFLSVQVGSDFYEYGGENIAVQEIYFHPSYDSKNLNNNLVIVRLTRQIAFRRKNNKVKRIDIDRRPSAMSDNGRITVVGWGARDDSNIIYNAYKNKLSYAELDFYPLKECQEHYTRDYVSTKNFCAGFFAKGGGACNRDAGGPAIMDNTLMGVISFGSSICGAPDSPTVFTKLGFYADWIDDIIDQDVPVSNKRTTNPPYVKKYTLIQPTKATTVKITPMGTTPEPKPIHNLAELRTVQAEDANDFFPSIFDSEEVKESFGKNVSESIEHLTLITSKKENRATANIPATGAINKLNQQQLNEDETYGISIESEHQILETSKKQNGATASVLTTETINKLSQQQLNEDETSDISIETEQKLVATSKQQNGATTKTINKLSPQQLHDGENYTISIETYKEFIKEEKPRINQTVKDDVMELIDNLDIDKLLNEMENNKKEALLAVESSNLEEQSGLNHLILTDTDEDGLSISTESFEDLTLRDGTTENMLVAVPESSLFEIMSLAIEEDLKQKQEAEELIDKGQLLVIK